MGSSTKLTLATITILGLSIFAISSSKHSIRAEQVPPTSTNTQEKKQIARYQEMKITEPIYNNASRPIAIEATEDSASEQDYDSFIESQIAILEELGHGARANESEVEMAAQDDLRSGLISEQDYERHLAEAQASALEDAKWELVHQRLQNSDTSKVLSRDGGPI